MICFPTQWMNKYIYIILLYDIILHYITLYYITLYYIISYYIILYILWWISPSLLLGCGWWLVTPECLNAPARTPAPHLPVHRCGCWGLRRLSPALSLWPCESGKSCKVLNHGISWDGLRGSKFWDNAKSSVCEGFVYSRKPLHFTIKIWSRLIKYKLPANVCWSQIWGYYK